MYIFLFLSLLLQDINYKIVNTYPHNKQSFTQGLIYHNGFLYEGTGLNGKSRLMKVDYKSGNSLQTKVLNKNYFGEGITIFDDKIIQLTWKSCTAFIYDLKTMEEINSFTYQSEGWGITYNGELFIVSDGTEKLTFYDPVSFQKTHEIIVRGSDGKIAALNELEYINEEIFANVYQKNLIVRIDPYTGIVTGKIDLSTIVDEQTKRNKSAKELNGIAFNSESNTVFITGKFWDKIYEISLN